jgi:hypothetical protein
VSRYFDNIRQLSCNRRNYQENKATNKTGKLKHSNLFISTITRLCFVTDVFECFPLFCTVRAPQIPCTLFFSAKVLGYYWFGLDLIGLGEKAARPVQPCTTDDGGRGRAIEKRSAAAGDLIPRKQPPKTRGKATAYPSRSPSFSQFLLVSCRKP